MKSLKYSLILLFTFSIISAQTGSLRGHVIDKESKQPLSGVNVIILKTDFGAATDDAGEYIIDKIPVGVYEVKFSYIGFSGRIAPDVVIKSNKITYLNNEMQYVSVEGDEVTVTSGYFNNSQNSVVSAQSLSTEEIRRSPGAREDVSRMLQNLPGVNPSNDDRNDLLIRGGSPTEVLFVIDDFEISNPNHFGTQGSTGGPISMINNEFVENMDFYSGAFTSAYSNKLSGVMDIRFREGNRNATDGKLDLNFGGAGGYIETPLGRSGSVLLGAHRSFLDLFEGILDYGGVPVYNNIQGKISYDFSSSHKFSAIFLGGDDKIDIDDGIDTDDFKTGALDTADYDKTIFKTRQVLGGIRLQSFWTKNFYTLISASHNYNKFYTDNNVIYTEGLRQEGKDELTAEKKIMEKDVYDNSSVENVSTLKFTANLLLGQLSILTSGVYAKINSLDYNIVYMPENPNEPDKFGQLPKAYTIKYKADNQLKYGAFINWNQKFAERFTFNAGLRADRFELINSFSVSPRFNLQYKINEKINIHGGYGIYYQNPEMIWILSDANNKNTLKDIKCTHYILGTDYILTPSLKLTLEAYLKNYDNYPVSADSGYSMSSLANTGSDYGNNLTSNKLISKGSGRGYGVEFMLQKKMSGNFYGIISYSWSDIKHKALDGKLRRGAYDNKNVLNIISGWRINDNYEVSVKFRYSGGNPYTPYDVQASKAAGRGVYNLSAINSAVFPSYQRFDIRVDHRDFFEAGTVIEYISIENVFGRKNVLFHKWDRNEEKIKYSYQTGFFIVGGISFEF
ncbi:MAG: TonB-dependent receptor [Ignavibacteria bacterium]|nr:TonB-dependent receptor [Ignavibacteria bacterium]